MRKKVAILGSTGSIGEQALEVIDKHNDKFELVAISAGSNFEKLISQAKKFKPKYVGIQEEKYKEDITYSLKNLNIKVIAGKDASKNIVSECDADIILISIVGFAGLYPTIEAIKKRKDIALANKETIVVAGEYISKLIQENNVKIIPVDSEHSAIFQCLQGELIENVEKIYLTASGGPFRGKKKEELLNIVKEDALKHPNWCMGNKITIDSATLMNKGLEAIEARWLFNLLPEQIEVIIHPQSIIHSIVQFKDGSMKAQMSLPDMRLPILYSLSYPERIKSELPRLDLYVYQQLTFEKPDLNTFPCLELALYALNKGGNIPCILNAANEEAVKAFLFDKIKFYDIPKIVEKMIFTATYIKSPSIEDYIECDRETRKKTNELIK